MKLLILGGTRFLGRHFVDAALAREHAVTVFTRGVSPVPWPERVRHLTGNRDPQIAPGLVALAGSTWDAAIDLSGYLPRCVNASCAALEDCVGHYTFVSSASVYADVSRPGIDETAPVAQLDDPSSEDIAAHYGALKARCEDEVRAAFGGRAFVVRPGLIVGPFDSTDRFGYWVARFVCPALTGERADSAVVPAPPDRFIQFIDARDLATWMLDMVERKAGGTFDACTPAGMWTMGALVEHLAAGARATGSKTVAQWVDDEALLRHGVTPWTGAAVDSCVGCRVRRLHAPALRARARARPRVPSARANDRRHCRVAPPARQLGRVAQRTFCREGAGDSRGCRGHGAHVATRTGRAIIVRRIPPDAHA
jgi:2'-hydroxyisoflavone reductase